MVSVMDTKQLSSGPGTVSMLPNFMGFLYGGSNTSYAESHDTAIYSSSLGAGSGGGVWQMYYAAAGKNLEYWEVRQLWLGFNTTDLVGKTISSVTMNLYSLGTMDSDGGFTLECRCVDFGAALDTADWKSAASGDASWGTLGASLSSASLAGVGQRTLTPSGTNMATHITASGNNTRFLFNINKNRLNSGTPSGSADKFNLLNVEYSTAYGRTELVVVTT
jgi:hypothetical protein